MPVPMFHNADDPIGSVTTVGEFWRWAMSDLLGNRNRGILAEFLVAKALGDETLARPRIEWDCYDIVYRDFRIEVKSSAYVQSWHSSPSKRSTLSFSVGPHECWDARTNTNDTTRKRHADLYVFCVFPTDPSDPSRDVLNVEKWGFFVTTTTHMEQFVTDQTSSIGITALREICGTHVSHGQLKAATDDLLDTLS